jgi:hypothetical protein
MQILERQREAEERWQLGGILVHESPLGLLRFRPRQVVCDRDEGTQRRAVASDPIEIVLRKLDRADLTPPHGVDLFDRRQRV